MKIKLCFLFFALLFAGLSESYSQICTTLGQNPSTAFPVCGTATFNQNTVPICGGTSIPGLCPAPSGLSDRNPFWYRFRCYIGGTLSFTITPNNLADDYDWQLFDVTGRNPTDVYTDVSLFVACNWSGFAGATGASSTGTGLVNCAGNFPLFSAMPTIIVNHDYLLLISHFTNTQSGYQLAFTMGRPGEGTASITDPANPIPVVTTASPSCDATQVIVRFNKPIKCSSLATNGSDFVLTPAAAITSVTGYGCSTGFNLDSVLITLSAPLPPGNYSVAAATGTDGNTLLDNCDRPVVVGDDATFTINPSLPLPMGIVAPPPCAPTSLTISFGDPIKCNSIAANGTDFTISGPSTITIISAAAVNCNANGETNIITIQLSGPVTTSGTYQLNLINGSDGNTVIGPCNRQVTAGSNTPFIINPQPLLAMGIVAPPPCVPQTLTLNFTEPIDCSSIAANGSDFMITGPSAVTVSGASAINCTNGTTTSISIQLSAAILITGSYNIQMVTGTDGNTLTGSCARQVNTGSLAPFVLAPQPAIAMGTVVPPGCTPQTITLNFADPINCSTIAANGSDFIVTGPSVVTVISATAVNCDANGETTTITLQFNVPVLGIGNFSVQVATGTDGNTLIGQCGRQVNAGSVATFNLAPQPPLPLGTLSPVNCSPSSVTLNFTDQIDCMSISGDGSEFIVTGPSGVTVIGASGPCNINPNVHAITVQFAGPITVSGTYQLQIKNGSDGNTLRGDCNRFVSVGDFVPFTIPPALPVAMDSIVRVACSPSSLKLIFPGPIRCSSIAPNGSDFIVNGPSPVSVTSASGSCDANGLTASIDIQLASPIVTGGVYTLQLVSGTDGNTLLSDCNRPTAAGSSLTFNASDTVSARFQTQVRYGCDNDTATFTHDGLHNVNQWTWTVNGAAAGNSSSVTQIFSAASQNQVQLAVSNGICNATYTAAVNFNNKVVVAFDLPESACPEDTIVFKNRSTGAIDFWQWTFGNGNTSSVMNPPAQVYPLTGVETLYTVSLTAGSNNGCQASSVKTMKVLSACIIAVPSAFTPNGDGLNDYLYPLNALKAENLDFQVFNRWGQLIFHSTDWQQKWDGTINGVKQGTGVYVWMLKYTNKDTKQNFSMRGTSTLIR